MVCKKDKIIKEIEAILNDSDVSELTKKHLALVVEMHFKYDIKTHDLSEDGILVFSKPASNGYKSGPADWNAMNKAHNVGVGVLVTRIASGRKLGTDKSILKLGDNEHFGNPFGVTKYDNNAELQNMGTGVQVSELYSKWLNRTLKSADIEARGVSKEETTKVMKQLAKRRDWINKQIDSGKLDGVDLIYNKSGDEKWLNHAKVLRDIVKDRAIERSMKTPEGKAEDTVETETEIKVETVANTGPEIDYARFNELEAKFDSDILEELNECL